ncbi:hypothetical protein [Streptomyces sp. NPDC002690]
MVQALDPSAMATPTGPDTMARVANDATRRLDSVLAQLAKELPG